MAASNSVLAANRNDIVVLKIVKQLCVQVTGLNEDNVLPYFNSALFTLQGNFGSSGGETSEIEVAEKIKRKFVRQKREKSAVLFAELHRKLRSQSVVKDCGALLSLLYTLGDLNKSDDNTRRQAVSGLSSSLVLPTWKSVSTQSTLSVATIGGLSSGFSSVCGSFQSSNPSITPQSLLPSALQTPFTLQYGMRQAVDRTLPSVGVKLLKQTDRGEPSLLVSMPLSHSVSGQPSRFDASSEVPEGVLLKEVIYALQGIEGKYIKYDILRDCFAVDTKIGVAKPARKLVGKLVENGLLFSRVRKFADTHSSDRAYGLVGQSFCTAIHQQLAEYYRLVAVLAAQLQQEEDQGVVCTVAGGLTLRRLIVWMSEPLVRLKTLAALVDICEGKKGGALASAVYSYLNHGDPSIRSLVRRLLTVVVQPVYTTILRWIYEGELEDMYEEFFVAADSKVKDDRLWHDKYALRAKMIPTFLSQDQAKKILLTGKAINFLRQVCHDRSLIHSSEVIQVTEACKVETIFTQDLDGAFDKMVDAVYKETSQHLLHILYTKYKFMDHLKAMRRYLLLGQGDFIRHLMDLLEEDLAKPAQMLFLHNLTGILETAVRATNAQYDDADILKRLDVRLLEVSPGDVGWDVFCLEYHVSGHIRTVFTPECMTMYRQIFNFLWRAKRMEYVLSMIWKEQMSNYKVLCSMPELQPALHMCQLIVSEMLHFIQQVQYYINFEVLECSWDELLHKVKEAGDLDHIIAAHEEFLDTVTIRSLLDEPSFPILTQLRTIFDMIIKFQSEQRNIYHLANEELLARQNYEQRKIQNTDKGDWGLTEAEEEVEERRRVSFCKAASSSCCSQLRIVQQTYQHMVQSFLEMLKKHSDINLRFLSFRLDFNEHYHTIQQSKSISRSGTGVRRTSKLALPE